jgi:hypothetical protein
MKFYKVIFKNKSEIVAAISGVSGLNKLDAIKKARKMVGVPSNVCLMGFAQELKFQVGDTFPPVLVRS